MSASARGSTASMTPSRTATQWCSRTAPAGSTGMIQRGTEKGFLVARRCGT